MTEPPASIDEPGRRQQARLLAALLVCMIPLAVLAGIVTGMTIPPESPVRDPLLPVGLGAAGVLALAYGLNRAGHQKIAATIAIAVINLGVYGLLINGLGAAIVDPELQSQFLVYVMLPILLASVLLPPQRVAVVIAFNLGAILALPLFFAQLTYGSIAFGPLSFIVIASSLVLVAGWHRRRVGQERQAALMEKEERYRTLLETAFEGVAIYAGDRLLDANEGLARMAGYDLAELAGMPVMSFIAEEAQDQIMQEILAGGKQTYETLGVRKDGSTYHLEVVLKTHEYEGRQVQIVAVRDVSDRKQAEEALQESEKRYRALVEASPDGILHTDLEANILTVNREMLKLHGCDDPNELVGKNGLDLLVPEEREQAQEVMQIYLQTGERSDGRYTLIRKDGTTYPVELNVALLTDAHGKPSGILNVIRDITERQRMESALRQHNAELQLLTLAGQALNASLEPEEVLATALHKACSLLQSPACSIWLIDQDTQELVCNRTTGAHAEIVSGWRLPPGEGIAGWVAQTGESLIVPDTEAEARYFKGVEQKTGTIIRSILSVPLRVKDSVLGVVQILDPEVGRFQPADQALLESLVESAAIALENARLYERLRLRMDELRRAQAQLVQSGRMAAIGELAAGVAHELNNPLMSILGFTELLLERTPADDPSRKQLETVFRQATQVRDIVRSLLNFSKQTGFHREPADLSLVVRQAVSLIRLRLVAAGIALDESYAPDLPALLLDSGRMQQVVLNLLTNALDAMPDGGHLAIQTNRNGDRVALSIVDSGTGIAPQHLARIFEPFFTTKPVDKGSGLGLSISLGIVQEHGGRIEVQSEAGKGSTFTVWLPVEAAASAPQAPAESR